MLAAPGIDLPQLKGPADVFCSRNSTREKQVSQDLVLTPDTMSSSFSESGALSGVSLEAESRCTREVA